MSTEYGASICVGFRFTFEEALKPFEKWTGKDKFRLKKRFDPDTGKELEPEKVYTSRKQKHHEFGEIRTSLEEDMGEEDVTEHDFLEKVAEKIGAQVCVYGYADNEEEYFAVFMPKKHPEDTNDGCDNGQFSASGNLSWAEVAGMADGLMALRRKLVKVGLKPQEPEVCLAWSIS